MTDHSKPSRVEVIVLSVGQKVIIPQLFERNISTAVKKLEAISNFEWYDMRITFFSVMIFSEGSETLQLAICRQFVSR
jgi:2-hydroxy-3-keto-5-methylthiopentenyl-1-phosphate phosphatase